MAFALLGVAGMFPAALRAVLSGGQTTKATALAREMVEMIRGDDFSQIRTNYNNLNTNNVTVDCLSFPPNPPTYGADFNKKRWKCDLRATAAGISGQPLSEGQGLPNAVGTVIVACVNPNGTTKTCNDATDLLRRVGYSHLGEPGIEICELGHLCCEILLDTRHVEKAGG